MALLGGLAWFVMQSMDPREEGGSVTGGIESPQPASDPMVARLESAVQSDPDNVGLRNDLAQAYLERDNLMGVFEQTSFVLQQNPNDSRALTLQALVRMAMGEADMATEMLQNAARIDPTNLDAWVSLAWVHAQRGRMDEAEKMIAEAVKQSPANQAKLEDVLRQMKMQVSGQQQPQELPEGHPPIAAPAGPSVRVTLQIDPAASLKSGTVFVIARNPAGGPPVAVKRVQVSQFPTTVDLSTADSMMGQPLPDRFLLEARLDGDGDAATRPPGDPRASQEGVSPGAAVTLVLK
jgi:cytochrome c-type biogenesis protein CcmH